MMKSILVALVSIAVLSGLAGAQTQHDRIFPKQVSRVPLGEGSAVKRSDSDAYLRDVLEVRSLGGVYNIRAYGAMGDGMTDDTAAIASAASAASGKVLFFPPGTYVNNTIVTVGAGTTLLGSGVDSVISGKGFKITDNVTVAGLKFIGPESGHIIIDTTTGRADIEIRNNTFSGSVQGVFINRTSDNTTHANIRILNNSFENFTGYGFLAIRMDDSLIEGNSFSGTSASRAISFFGGSRNRIVGNRITAGVTGIAFVFQNSTASYRGAFRANAVVGNTIENVSEESISFDIRGNAYADMAPRELDTIASKNASSDLYHITLKSANWTTAATLFGYRACFSSGSLRGLCRPIDAHTANTATFTVDLTADEYAAIAAGDEVVIGAPSLYNTVQGNTIVLPDDVRTATGIMFWGLAYNNTITGNTIYSPRTDQKHAGIELASLMGLDDTGSVTKPTNGLKAPVENNIVVGNTVLGGIIWLRFKNYAGAGDYSSDGNVVVANAVHGGKLLLDRHEDLSFCNIAGIARASGSDKGAGDRKRFTPNIRGAGEDRARPGMAQHTWAAPSDLKNHLVAPFERW